MASDCDMEGVEVTRRRNARTNKPARIPAKQVVQKPNRWDAIDVRRFLRPLASHAVTIRSNRYLNRSKTLPRPSSRCRSDSGTAADLFFAAQREPGLNRSNTKIASAGYEPRSR